MAAHGCPMKASAVTAASAHDCCPDHQPDEAPDDQSQHDMDGCMMGVSCRSGPIVTPSLAPIRLPTVVLSLKAPILGEPVPPSGPLQELFRPPRTI
jgi:hypothetical protein